MPHNPASRPTSTRSRQNAQHLLHAQSVAGQSARTNRRSASDSKLIRNAKNSRRASSRESSSGDSHRRKVLWAGGAITLLAMATILPTQVSSQAIADNKCEQVVKSGVEVSRSQLSSLVSIPEGSTKEAVRQVVSDPYCVLPALSEKASAQKAAAEKTATEEIAASNTDQASSYPSYPLEREAYPLAFDPDAWLVLTYHSNEYQGYDFVFKR